MSGFIQEQSSSSRGTFREEEWRKDRDKLSRTRPAFPVASPRPAIFDSESTLSLPKNYKLTKYDVINGRGRKSYHHVGNRRFRQMAALNLRRYFEAERKVDKSTVVSGIVQAMRESCPSGGFLKYDSKRSKGQHTHVWLSIGGRETREKVGHCLRDMIAAMREDERRKDQFVILNAPKSCSRPLVTPNTLPTTLTQEQRSVLRLLELGFDGSVDELFLRSEEAQHSS